MFVEQIGVWIAQYLFVRHLRIVPLKKAMGWGFDWLAFKDMFRYGTFVVARQYLLYIADQSQFLWLLFVQLFLSKP